MTIYRGTYYSAKSCKSANRTGTIALVAWYVGAYQSRGAAGLGTYACKVLGTGWSIHAERRAADLGTVPYGGADSAWGWKLADALRLNSAELGIQCIILGHKIWSCRYPDAGWRIYHGQHHGHLHVELTPAASTSLTAAKIQNIIGGVRDNMLVKEGDSGEQVRFWQYVLKDLGFDPGVIDGEYGPKMRAAVNMYRKVKGSTNQATQITGWQGWKMLADLAKKRSG